MANLSNKNFAEIVVGIIRELSGYFLTFITSLTILIFIWGIVKYIYKADSEAERKKGKSLMLWGLIGLFVLFGIWGIQKMLANTFGIKYQVPPQFNKNSYIETPSVEKLSDQKVKFKTKVD